MKSEELMIGDWVNTNQIVNPIKKVTASMINYTDDEIARFEPIPLTTEILLANGFERNEYFDYNSCTFFSFPTGVFTKRSGFGIEKRDDVYYITDHALMPIKYVHEFQQALRICKLTDIANNFKIN